MHCVSPIVLLSLEPQWFVVAVGTDAKVLPKSGKVRVSPDGDVSMILC